jgi:hypothetical protein
MPKQELELKYQEHGAAMARLLREQREHIEANAQLDLSETELVEAIDSMLAMLSEARYHADRMRIYRNLMGEPKRCNCVKLFRLPAHYVRSLGPHHYDTCPLYLAEAEVADR